MSRIRYYFDDTDFSTLNVTIKASKGVVDMPKRKEVLRTSWAYMNGHIPDLDTNYLEERTLQLEGFITAKSRLEFTEKLNALYRLVNGIGYHRLTIEIEGVDKPLIYIVYCAKELAVDKKWRQSNQVGTFTLTLIEPYPVKRILQFSANENNSVSLTINCTDTEDYDIFWGDKIHTITYYEKSTTVTHTYSKNGNYFIVICGDIDKITSIKANETEISNTTNPKIVWSKI